MPLIHFAQHEADLFLQSVAILRLGIDKLEQVPFAGHEVSPVI